MADEIKYMKLRTRNAKMMRLHSDKLTRVEKAINWRSNGLHSELQFSPRYGNISVSATRQDDCNCVRFKMIGYSHAYRWSTVYIPVTAEQESLIFADACRMADVEMGLYLSHTDVSYFNEGSNGCAYGPNAIKYDTYGASFSFISKLKIWKMSEVRQICNETCGLLLMVVWPDIFEVKKGDGLGFFECKVSFRLDSPAFMDDWKTVYPSIPPHEQTPDVTEYMVRHYVQQYITCDIDTAFPSLGNPTQEDIDNIITEINGKE
jgi:hypothetical protein